MESETDKPRILIVDDVPGNIKALAEVLHDDHQILMAVNGRDALETASAERVDLILLDVVMPEMDGYQVCRELKTSPKTRHIPVIFVTAKNEPTDETHALSLGGVDFLSKPVVPAVVKARVETHLGLKRAREALELQNTELREAAKLREEVDCMMQHDIKSPLQAIIGVAGILRSLRESDDEQQELCQMIQDSGYKLLNIINLSLDMFKMERGGYAFDPKTVNLVEMVERVCSAWGGQFSAKDLDYRIRALGAEPPPDFDFMILGEETLCYSVLCNLLQNAVDASPIGGTITFDFEVGEPCALRIHNQGVVPEDIRGRFFEKFATGGKAGGTGLGTYSARLMMETQGGGLDFETSETEGTTLKLGFLPASGQGEQ